MISRKSSKIIMQVKLFDKRGNEILLIENHNGAIALSLLDDNFILKQGSRPKQDKPTFVMIDELDGRL